MKRRVQLALTATLAASACHAATSDVRTDARHRPPGIVLVVVDDLGWHDLGCTGSTFYETPRIDAFARDSIRFTDAYSSGPNCAPTRAALMSGQYAPRTGVYTVGSGNRGKAQHRTLEAPPNRTVLQSEVVTLAERLQAAGYRTGHVGKWHLGDEADGASPLQQGFDVNVAGTRAGSPATYFQPWGERVPGLEGEPGEYLTDRLTDEAIDFLRTSRDRPFFLHLSFFAVHTPIQARPELRRRFTDKPTSGGQANPAYAGMIAAVDANIGRVLDELDALGIARDTLVLVTSDNGGLGGYADAGVPGSPEITSNAPLRGGKGMLAEGGIRVPLLVRLPGAPRKGRVCATPVTTVDFYPTLLELAGIDSPRDVPLDGVSLVPLLTGDGSLPHERALYWHFPGYLESARDGRTWRATPTGVIRRGRWKLLEHFETDQVELYDLQADQGETHDLSRELPELTLGLLDELQSWRARIDAPMPTRPARAEGPR